MFFLGLWVPFHFRSNTPTFEHRMIDDTVYKHSLTRKFQTSYKTDRWWKRIKTSLERGEYIFGTRFTWICYKHRKLAVDDILSITTRFLKIFQPFDIYATSYSRVSTFTVQNNRIELVISNCSENIVDGYYRIILHKKHKRIQCKVYKVQSPNIIATWILYKLVNESNKKNIKSMPHVILYHRYSS